MLRWGPQPREAIESVLLQEFPAYTRETLLAADWTGLQAIVEYRRAREALALFNGGAEGAATLQDHPELLDLLLEMARAQSPETTEELLLADLERKRPKDNDG